MMERIGVPLPCANGYNTTQGTRRKRAWSLGCASAGTSCQDKNEHDAGTTIALNSDAFRRDATRYWTDLLDFPTYVFALNPYSSCSNFV